MPKPGKSTYWGAPSVYRCRWCDLFLGDFFPFLGETPVIHSSVLKNKIRTQTHWLLIIHLGTLLPLDQWHNLQWTICILQLTFAHKKNQVILYASALIKIVIFQILLFKVSLNRLRYLYIIYFDLRLSDLPALGNCTAIQYNRSILY